MLLRTQCKELENYPIALDLPDDNIFITALPLIHQMTTHKATGMKYHQGDSA